MNNNNGRLAARRLLAAGLAACLLGAAACHKNAGPQASASATAPDDSSQQSKDEAYTTLPPEYPKAIPIYPGAKIEHVRKAKGVMREIFFNAPAQLDQIIAFYKEQLPKGSYDISSALRIAARKTWSCDFHKGGQQGSLMLYPSDEDKTQMTIDLTYQMPATVASVPTMEQENFDVIGPGPPPQIRAPAATGKRKSG